LEEEETQFRGNLELMEKVERTEVKLARNDQHIATMVNKKIHVKLNQEYVELSRSSAAEKQQLEKLLTQLTKAKDVASEKLNELKKAQRVLSQRLGRAATITELAAEIELTPKQVREYLLQSRQPLSLDLRVGDNQDTELGELLEDDGLSPEDFTAQSALRQDLENLMADLTPQQKQVLTLRYGLDDGQTMTLAKIGDQLNISRERVRQIEREALAKLRKRKQNVQEYLAS